MARGDASSGNKAAAVREVMATGLAKPKDVAAKVNEQFGLDVTPAYVSAIKNLDRKKGGKPARRKTGAPVGRPPGRPKTVGKATASVGAADAISAGVDFVKRAGGLDAARKTLDQIEVIKNSL